MACCRRKVPAARKQAHPRADCPPAAAAAVAVAAAARRCRWLMVELCGTHASHFSQQGHCRRTDRSQTGLQKRGGRVLALLAATPITRCNCHALAQGTCTCVSCSANGTCASIAICTERRRGFWQRRPVSRGCCGAACREGRQAAARRGGSYGEGLEGAKQVHHPLCVKQLLLAVDLRDFTRRTSAGRLLLTCGCGRH